MMASGEFPKLMGPVAMRLWGQPRDITKGEMRWGSHGSKAVDIEKGTWFDHETKEGGGVLALVERETGAKGAERVAWLRREGFDLSAPGGKTNGHAKATSNIIATYDYVDETGELIFQVVRLEPKTFRQRRKARPDDPPDKVSNGWVWSVKGLRLVPFRLPELVEAIALGQTVFFVEGEKDVNGLWQRGLPATCNPMGAGKWSSELTEHFRGANVVILPDNDEPGQQHAEIVSRELQGVAESVKVLALPGLPPKGDVSDWFAAGGTAEQLYALVETRETDGPPRPASRYGTIDWDEIDSWQVKFEWLVKDIMPVGSVAVAYGPSQCGKSFLMQDLALCVATGREFFGRQVRPGGAVYVAAEGKAGFRKRLVAYRRHHKLPKSGVPFSLVPTSVNLFDETGDTEPLIEEIKTVAARFQLPLRVVVIDTLSAVAPGFNENASEDMGRVLRHCQQIQEATNATVIIVHHTPAGGGKPRGHTSLPANVDTMITVNREDGGDRWFRVSKQKDGDEGQRVDFTLKSVWVETDDDGNSITSCVVEPAQADPQASEKSRRLKLSDRGRIGLQALRAALVDFGQPASPGLSLPFGTVVAPWAAFRREFDTRLVGDDLAPAAKRKAIERVRDELVSKGYMAGNHDLQIVWSAK